MSLRVRRYSKPRNNPKPVAPQAKTFHKGILNLKVNSELYLGSAPAMRNSWLKIQSPARHGEGRRARGGVSSHPEIQSETLSQQKTNQILIF